MIIIGLTDIHGMTSSISDLGPVLSSADIILIAGDITHFGFTLEAKEIIESVRKHNPHLLAVTGNCDHEEVNQYLTDENINLHRISTIINKFAFFGVGGSLSCPGGTPNELSEEDFKNFLTEAISDIPEGTPKIMLSHQPPYDTLNDLAYGGIHVGSKSSRDFIDRVQPLICFTGHIHESPGIDEIGKTRTINPGPLKNRNYAFADVGSKVETLEIRSF